MVCFKLWFFIKNMKMFPIRPIYQKKFQSVAWRLCKTIKKLFENNVNWNEEFKFCWNDVLFKQLKRAHHRCEAQAATENLGKWLKTLTSNPSLLQYDDLNNSKPIWESWKWTWTL